MNHFTNSDERRQLMVEINTTITLAVNISGGML